MSGHCGHKETSAWTTRSTPRDIAFLSLKHDLCVRFTNQQTGQELFVEIDEAYISARNSAVVNIKAARSTDGKLNVSGVVCADLGHGRCAYAELELTPVLHIVSAVG